jgi:hypothetical protein
MNEHNELIELLMGKFLDGDISPSEQRLLDDHLANNPDAGTLFAQLTRLHEISQEAIQTRILDQGRSAGDIFAQAWEQAGRKRPLHIISRIVFSQFTSGLAAGLLVAVGLLLWQHHTQTRSIQNSNPPYLAKELKPYAEGPVLRVADSPEAPLKSISPEVLREVDWYHFTDQQGNRYVIEGLRENTVQPVVFRSDF